MITTDEHLDLIVARCRELLSLAEKRTQGEWCNDPLGTQCIGDISTRDAEPIAQAQSRQPLRTSSLDHERIANSNFIAACAGNAEAGWRSTIAAIRIARHCIWNGHYQAGITAAREIIEAWPIELLTK